MSHNEYQYHTKKLGKWLVVVYVYLWLQAMPYDCTNITFTIITKFIVYIKKLIYKTCLYTDYSQLILCFFNSLWLYHTNPKNDLPTLTYKPTCWM